MYAIVKRSLDVVLALSLLILLSPIMIAVGAMVAMTSGRPIIFRQERVGLRGRHFEILKFRTMTVGAGNGRQFTVGGDPRITRLGAVLRRYKVDEVPQLLNVLAGDMSFVGPRPEVPMYVDMFAADYAAILRVRPGLTDYAAIVFRDEEQILARSADPARTYVEEILPAKLALYRDYLRTRSISVDVSLIARTVWSIISQK